MDNTIINRYTKEQLEKLTAESTSFRDLIFKLGYHASSGANHKDVRNKLIKYGIDFSHFSRTTSPTIRNEENVFVENSTACQSTLRR